MICVDAKGSDYLTTGKKYEVSAGEGDEGVFGYIGSNAGFEIIDDYGYAIFQYKLDGLHGLFKVKK